MTLVAPKPVRIFTSLQLPFFLSNALYTSNAPNPVLHAQLQASVNAPLPEPEADVPPEPSAPTQSAPSVPSAPPASGNQSRVEASNIKSTLSLIESGQSEKSLEELAASIRLDDEPQPQYAQYPPQNQQNQNQYNRPPSTSFLFGGSRSNATSPPASARSVPEDGPPATPRSPESAVLDEFLSILRPVIRAPSSPIARSKRLLPRSRHHHHHHHGHGHGHGTGLAPSSDRHHPYARSAKSTSPSYDSHTHGGDGNSGTKRSLLSCGRSSATTYGRRRSSNANESTHSHGSTSMSSSRSQSISRNGSDNSSDEFNAWRPISPPDDVNMQMDTFNDQDQEPGPSPASGSGPGTTITSLLVLPAPSSHAHIASPDQQ